MPQLITRWLPNDFSLCAPSSSNEGPLKRKADKGVVLAEPSLKRPKGSPVSDPTDTFSWMKDPSHKHLIGKYLEDCNEHVSQYFERSQSDRDKLYREFCENGKELEDWDDLGEIFPDLSALDCYDFFKIMNTSHNEDASFTVFSVDTTGAERAELWIKETSTGEIIESEKICDASATCEWSHDGKGFWYLKLNPLMRAYQVLYHKMGTEVQNDTLVFQENDEFCELSIYKSADDQVLFLASTSKQSSEVYVMNAHFFGEPLTPMHSRGDDILSSPDLAGDSFYIKVKKEGESFLMQAARKNPSLEHWKMCVSHREGVEIEDFRCFSNHIVLCERSKGRTQLTVVERSSLSCHEIHLEDVDAELKKGVTGREEALKENALFSSLHSTPLEGSLSLQGGFSYDTLVLHLSYSKSPFPKREFEYEMSSKEIKELVQEGPEPFDTSDYVAEKIYAPSKDGTPIPISLFYRKNIQRDGTAPLILHTCGTYGITEGFLSSNDPEFSLVDKEGFIYAMAHIRGRGEYGTEWDDGGRLFNKMNSIEDFISVEEYLLNHSYTSKDRLVIRGVSNGGVVVTAAANRRPDLCRVVVAELPFVDAMGNSELPLTIRDYTEFGDSKDPKVLDDQLRYCPYHNIKSQDYPSMFVTAEMKDSQEPFFLVARYVAKLRQYSTSENPVLFRTNMKGGPHGGSYTDAVRKEEAEKWAFVLQEVAPL